MSRRKGKARRMTARDLIRDGYRKNSDGSWSRPSALVAGVCGAELERHAAGALDGEPAAEERGAERIGLRVEHRRVALLDEDNLQSKYLVDCARRAGLIPDDAPELVKIVNEQVKVPTAEVGTLVEITFPPGYALPREVEEVMANLEIRNSEKEMA